MFDLVSRVWGNFMESDRQQKNDATSPEERYRDLERESAEWSERVEESVRKLDRVTKQPARRQSSQRRKATPA